MTLALRLHSQRYRHSHLDVLGETLHFLRPRGFTEHTHCVHQFFSPASYQPYPWNFTAAVNWGLI